MATIRFPWQRKTVNAVAEQQAFLQLAYQLVLQRPADNEGLAAYLQRMQVQGLTSAEVLQEMQRSEEYARLQTGFDITTAPEMQWYLSQRDIALERDLQAGTSEADAAFSRIWQEIFESGRELIIGQADYAPLHRARFEELFSSVRRLLAGRDSPRLLEFGVSEFSGFYKRLWPELHLELSDRPTAEDYPGFTRERSLALSGAAAYHEVDLENSSSMALPGNYDVIVLAEVLEHLVVNPVELLQVLLGQLSLEGVLYLTTPNFFRQVNLEQLVQQANPQEVFPAGEGNWDAHFHHREYGAREILGYIRDAGGCCRSFHFSACWDDITTSQGPKNQFGNMVFVISR